MTTDEREIRELIARWARAVREEDRDGIRADHAEDMLMFDVPPPFQSRGLPAYMETWELFFSTLPKPIVFDFSEIQVVAGSDVAFATATGRCVWTNEQGEREPLDFRLTMGLQKVNGRWQVRHEHHSVPAD